MALLFSPVNKPKRFTRHKGYYGEKKERQQWLEERVRKIKIEQGEIKDEDVKAEDLIRGSFIEGTQHLKRRKEKEENGEASKENRYIKLFLFIFMLLMVYYWLVKTA